MNVRQTSVLAANHSLAVRSLINFMKRDISKEERRTTFDRPLNEALGAARIPNIVDAGTKAVSDYLAVIFLRQSANPSKKDAVKRLQDTFSREAYSWRLEYDSFITELEARLMISEEVALVGHRGCGKTAIINEWLNERTKSFFEDKLNSNWFRIDVTKLYNIYGRKSEFRRRFSMADYFKCHSSYVLLEYSGMKTNPYATRSDESSPLLSFIAEDLQTGPDAEEVNDIINIIDGFYHSLSDIVDISQRPSETVIRELCRDYNTTSREAFLRLFVLFCKSCSQNNVGITAIIDGIDNSTWSLKDDVYKDMCAEAQDFVRKFPDTCPKVKRRILLVARSETIPELNITQRTDNQDHARKVDRTAAFDVIMMTMADPVKVISRKLTAAEKSHWFNKERSQCASNLEIIDGKIPGANQLRKFLEGYNSDHEVFLKQIASEMNDLIGRVLVLRNSVFLNRIPHDNLLEALFDGNLRAMLNVFRRSKEGRELSNRIGVQGALSAIKLTEYMMLGGKVFFDSTCHKSGESRFAEIPAGEVFPNIFYYSQIDSIALQTNWHGLVGLRMLQIANLSGIPGGDMMQILHFTFGYDPIVLIEHLEAFVAFGLLSIEFRGEKANLVKVSENSPFLPYKSVVRTTTKGQLIATLSMFWADWMYFLALDTPLYRECLPRMSGNKYIRFYRSPRNPVVVEHNYIDAMVPTVATFVRHIGSKYRAEMRSLSNLLSRGRLTKVGQGYIASEAWHEVFSIPLNWEEHIKHQVEMKLASRMRAVRDGKTDEIQWAQYENLVQTLMSFEYVGSKT